MQLTPRVVSPTRQVVALLEFTLPRADELTYACLAQSGRNSRRVPLLEGVSGNL